MFARILAAIARLRARRHVEAEVDDELRFHVEMETEANRARGLGVLVGIAPAAQAMRVNVLAALGGVAPGVTARLGSRLRHGVVVPQVALSLAVLIVAGVHVKALAHLELANLGYRTDGIAVLNVGDWSPPARAEIRFDDAASLDVQARHVRAFYQALYERIRDTPGTAAALTDRLPASGDSYNYPSEFISQEAFLAGGAAAVAAATTTVSPAYFRVMGLSVLRGRDFDDRDVYTSPHVAIVSEVIAARLWPGGDALGRMIAAYSPDKPNPKPDWLQIVGVVNEVDPVLQDVGRTPFVDTPAAQAWRPEALIVVASAPADPSAVIRTLEQEISGANAFAEVWRVRPMADVVGEILYPRRAAAAILGASGLIGLLLASIGLYGVVSYSVAERLREIGIRATLGAARRDILRLVLGEGVVVAVIGAVPGFALALISLRLTSSLVGAVPTRDLFVFAAVPVVVGAVILAACYVPARRAAAVDPMRVLRGL